MSTRTQPWPDGTPCWFDLVTTRREQSWDFYRAVFGWTIAASGEQFAHYGVATVNGLAVAGIGEGPIEGPPAWTTYLATSDVGRSIEAVVAAGGAVAMAPTDIGDAGRMALTTDCNGALFGLWQAKDMIGAALVNEPGGVVWNENLSADPDAARAFYSHLFGFSYTTADEASGYVTIDGDGPGDTIGGVGRQAPTLPATWKIYFVVADVDAAVDVAVAHGGRAIEPATDTPAGRVAVLADPDGAAFGVGSGNPPP